MAARVLRLNEPHSAVALERLVSEEAVAVCCGHLAHDVECHLLAAVQDLGEVRVPMVVWQWAVMRVLVLVLVLASVAVEISLVVPSQRHPLRWPGSQEWWISGEVISTMNRETRCS
jgi:hypothetical protein